MAFDKRVMMTPVHTGINVPATDGCGGIQTNSFDVFGAEEAVFWVTAGGDTYLDSMTVGVEHSVGEGCATLLDGDNNTEVFISAPLTRCAEGTLVVILRPKFGNRLTVGSAYLTLCTEPGHALVNLDVYATCLPSTRLVVIGQG